MSYSVENGKLRCRKCGEAVDALAWFEGRKVEPHVCDPAKVKPDRCCLCHGDFRKGQRIILGWPGLKGHEFAHVHCFAKILDARARTNREAEAERVKKAGPIICTVCGTEIAKGYLTPVDEQGNQVHVSCFEKLPPLFRLACELRRKDSAREKLMQAGRMILEAIGADSKAEALKETPRRFADAWMEIAFHEDKKTDTTFESVEADQIVLVKGIRVWSFCEHHLLPFWCDVAIAYLAKDRILGLSKFARLAVLCASGIQTQERLARDIADQIERVTGSPDVAVLCRGEHTCMSMRGVKKDAEMSNVVVRGVFRSEPATRAEFYSLAQG